MLRGLRKFILPKRRIVLRFSCEMNQEVFTSLINDNIESIFKLENDVLRFRTWSFEGQKLDRCAFMHTSIRAKVRAKFVPDSDKKTLLNSMFPQGDERLSTFFLLIWFVISLGGLVTLLSSKGLLLSLGFVLLFSLVMVLFIRIS